MGKTIIKVTIYTCERCGHKWQPRQKAVPEICPKCKSASWHKPKKK